MKRQWLVVMMFMLASSSAWANDSALNGVGGNLQALKEHPTIVMERMVVIIDLFQNRAHVQCRYRFRNTGKATTVYMGFPETGNGNWQQPGSRSRGFISFSTWVNGYKVPVRISKVVEDEEGGWSRWRVKRVHFDVGQTRTITVRYTAPILKISDSPHRLFEYNIETGASWKGPIEWGKVVIRGHNNPARAWLQVPPEFTRTGTRSWEWRGKNFEPSEEIDIIYSPGIQCIQDGENVTSNAYPPYPYIYRGQVWVPVRLLEDWFRLDIQVTGVAITLSDEDHTVTLRHGSRHMVVDNQTILLPIAPRVEDGTLYVSFAPLARAFGITYSFNPKTKVLTFE